MQCSEEGGLQCNEEGEAQGPAVDQHTDLRVLRSFVLVRCPALWLLAVQSKRIGTIHLVLWPFFGANCIVRVLWLCDARQQILLLGVVAILTSLFCIDTVHTIHIRPFLPL